jgi:hypothetical protein
VEALNNFEMFDHIGANESRLGPDDKLAKNKIFVSKSTLNWVICDWSIRKNVQCWYKKVIKHDLLWNIKKRVVLEDYTQDLKRDQPREGLSQIKISTIVEGQIKS